MRSTSNSLSRGLPCKETRFTCYNFRGYLISKRSEIDTFITERYMAGSIFNTQLISFFLLGLGISGTITLVVAVGLVMRRYSDSPIQSFNWRLRNWRLKQLSALACLFFLAMAASYWVIQDAWGWIYLLVAFKTGTWWLRRATSREI